MVQFAWIGCCLRTDTKRYQCYTLSDWVCGTRPHNWGTNCRGHTPAGRLWFGGSPGNRSYTCTQHDPVGAQYRSGTDCARNCTPRNVPNTWLC
jgi:hypothetical protein